jgi:Na+-driven multidrug efflux pump
MLFPREMARIFTTDKTLIEMAGRGIRLNMIVFFVVGGQAVITNFFQCIGQVKISIFLSLTRQLIILIPLAFILPRFLGLDGVWYAMAASDFLSAAMTWPLLLFFLRRFKGVEQVENLKPQNG